MISKQAAVDRANKLLRLAGPKSGAAEAERTTAALEAARLIEEHGLVAAERVEQKKAQRPQAPKQGTRQGADWAKSQPAWGGEPDGFFTRTRPRQSRPSGGPVGNLDWNELITPSSCICAACGQVIDAGDRAWRSSIGWRHYDITCDQFR